MLATTVLASGWTTVAPRVASAGGAVKLLLDPDHGVAGSSFRAHYEWSGCGGIGAGSYSLELSWDTDADPLPPSGPLAYGGSGDCIVVVETEVPGSSAPGVHDVIAKLFDASKTFIGFSDIKAEFTVESKPKPSPTPKPEPTENPGPSTEPKPTAMPTDKPKPPTAPPSDAVPDASLPLKSAAPGGSEEPDTTTEPASSAGPIDSVGPGRTPADLPGGPTGAQIVPIEPYAEPKGSIVDVIGHLATDAGHVAGDVMLGGLTDLLIAMGRGIDPFADGDGPNLSRSPGEAIEPDVAATSTDVYIVWADSADGVWDVYLRRSVDHGYTFGPAINLSRSVLESRRPRVVVHGPTVSVVWDEAAIGAGPQILATRSTDGGRTFAAPTNLGAGSSPVVAASGGAAYVAWIGRVDDQDELFAQQLWTGAAVRVTKNGGANRNPVIAALPRGAALAWESNVLGDWDVSFALSSNGGRSWVTNHHENAGGGFVPRWSDYDDDVNPTITALGDDVVVAYEKSRFAHRYVHVHSGTGEQILAGRDRLVSYNYQLGTFDNVYDITDSTFSAPMLPSVTRTASSWAMSFLAASRTQTGRRTSLVHSVDGSPSSVIRYVELGNLEQPRIVSSGGRPVLVWMERSAPGAPLDVFLLGQDGGITNLSANGGDAFGPRAATSGSSITVVWTDTTNGTRQVHHATRPAR